MNFFSTEERMTWTSWMTWGWVNYQQKFFFFFERIFCAISARKIIQTEWLWNRNSNIFWRFSP